MTIIDEFSVELVVVDEGRSTITIEGYRGKSEKVVVPASIGGIPVTVIGILAFGGCENIKQVILPETITSIKCMAFNNCIQLTDINLPNGLVDIDEATFAECSNLETITLSRNTKIGYKALKDFSGKLVYRD